ncbi:MAG: rubrerythrin family protein [Gammaproteobacteria bacterium]|nr:rubrerythrin family protein [Gammaproteobacteria bacterium]
MRRTGSDNISSGPSRGGRNRRDAHRSLRHPGAGRRALLSEHPDVDMVDMGMLVQIARAIEDEAVRRYAMLARLMDSRGEPAVAAAFRLMLEEERRHVAAVDRWAASVGDPPPAATDYEWMLPEDLSSSWDDVAGSALLTPYRAFALAVDNEERAFAFYAYLAAHAESDEVRREAEKLGAEELQHAALLRRWRRRAYHRERGSTRPPSARHGPGDIDSVAALRDFLSRREAEVALAHLGLARRLERAGHAEGARLLEESIPAPARQAAATGRQDVAAPATDAGTGPEGDPRHLLVDAQRQLEEFADELEAIMAVTGGEVFEEASAALAGVIDRIAQVAFLQAGG